MNIKKSRSTASAYLITACALMALVVLVSPSPVIGQDEDASSSLMGSPREIRAAFMNHRLSTARGFGKRLMPSSALLEELRRLRYGPEFGGTKRGFRRNRISTARGFGKRSSPVDIPWDSDTAYDTEDSFDKRAFRRMNLQTARGFGKRTNAFDAEDNTEAAPVRMVGDWIKEPPVASKEEPQ